MAIPCTSRATPSLNGKVRKLCFILILFFLATGHALAHKVTVFAWVEGDTVFGESKFSSGRKAQGAEVIVWDTTGNELLRTRTDDNGEFSFPIPRKTGMRIELMAGMGHKGEWTIPLDEVTPDVPSLSTGATDSPLNSPAQSVTEDSPQAIDERKAPEPEKSAVQSTLHLPVSNQAELESIIEKSVDKSLDKKMKPLLKMMADLEQKGPTLNEIIGGIGYIFGLMGVVLYVKTRQG